MGAPPSRKRPVSQMTIFQWIKDPFKWITDKIDEFPSASFVSLCVCIFVAMIDQEEQGVGRFLSWKFWRGSGWRHHFASASPWEWLGHLFFITFILWCALYYQERLFNNDAAYYTWHMTAKEYPFVLHNRYINIFTQGWGPKSCNIARKNSH